MSNLILHKEAVARVMELEAELPLVGDTLLRTMNIQPELDPDAGDGVMQAATLFFGLELPKEQMLKFVELCRCSEWNFYIVVRGIYYKAIMQEEYDTHMVLNVPFKVLDILDTICSFVPSFNRDLALKNIAVG